MLMRFTNGVGTEKRHRNHYRFFHPSIFGVRMRPKKGWVAGYIQLADFLGSSDKVSKTEPIATLVDDRPVSVCINSRNVAGRNPSRSWRSARYTIPKSTACFAVCARTTARRLVSRLQKPRKLNGGQCHQGMQHIKAGAFVWRQK